MMLRYNSVEVRKGNRHKAECVRFVCKVPAYNTLCMLKPIGQILIQILYIPSKVHPIEDPNSCFGSKSLPAPQRVVQPR